MDVRQDAAMPTHILSPLCLAPRPSLSEPERVLHPRRCANTHTHNPLDEVGLLLAASNDIYEYQRRPSGSTTTLCAVPLRRPSALAAASAAAALIGRRDRSAQAT